MIHLCCYAKLIVTLKPFHTHPIACQAGVAKLGQRRRAKEEDAHASGAYPVEVRGFKSHPPHHLRTIIFAQISLVLSVE